MKKILILICPALILLASCSTSYTYIQVLKPAQFAVTPEIQSICVLNRAHKTRGQNLVSALQNITNNQPLILERQSTQTVIEQFKKDMTANSPRFTVSPLSIDTIGGTGGGTFPQPLSIGRVAQLCAANNAQGLVALEAFEIKPAITYSQSGTTITCKAVYETTLGWRFYDPKNAQMLDEYKYSYSKTFSGTGATQDAAYKNLPSKQKCLDEVLIPAANQYVARISPVYVNVSRAFHKKGSPLIESGYLHTKQNDWKGASDAWLQEITNPNPKIAGMAHYNIAVSFEVLGNLNDAMVWAKKAEALKTKWAGQYVRTLTMRIEELNKVRTQMGS